MKKPVAVFLMLAVMLGLGGCMFMGTENSASSVTDIPAVSAEPTPDTAAETEEDHPEAKPYGEPEADEEPAEEGYGHPIEAYFPESWAGRYVLEYTDNSVEISCKAAIAEETGDFGWLCTIILVTDPNYFSPEYTDLGMWEGCPVWMLMRSDVPVFFTDEIFGEWISMLQDTTAIIDALKQVLAEYGGAGDDTLYVTPERYVEYGYYTGVFRLICDDWTEESVETLLDPAYPYGFLSVAGDGTAYFMQGRKLLRGTVVMYCDDGAKPEDMPLYRFTFDGVTYEANMLQTMIVMENMPEYTCLAGDTEYTSSTWTFLHEEDDWWTEETFAGDIG